jgi:phospholipase C
MDNFALPNFERPDLAEVAAAYAYSQLHESDVPNYRYWAREYALCDNFFASVPGASYPNHLFFVAGHSGGVFDNPGEHAGRSFPGGGRRERWGCDALEDAFVLRREDGTTSPQARQARRDRRSIRAPRNGPRWPEQFRTVRERSFRFPIGTQS